MTKKEWEKSYWRACKLLGHWQAYIMYLNRNPDIATPDLKKDAKERVGKAVDEVDKLAIAGEVRGVVGMVVCLYLILKEDQNND